uniref:Uncharacterized protein n=1 Tax=Quercus lobata TaxID=97700 RepID=A0A7N2R4N5_QUELO
MRSMVQKELMMKEKESKERVLRALAQKARSERTGVAPPTAAMDSSDMRIDGEHEREDEKDNLPKETMEEREERMLREKMLDERCQERERERRLEAKDAAMETKKSKITRDRDQDISEKVALCMASSAGGAGRGGMDPGFATDDHYNVYDKALFTAQPTLSTLYSRPNKNFDSKIHGATEQLGMTSPRDGPLEFYEDYFGLDQFLTEVNEGKKALEKVGPEESTRASAESSK